MHCVTLSHAADFEGWRLAARHLAAARVPASQARFRIEGEPEDLFRGENPIDDGTPPPAPEPLRAVRVRRSFLDLAAMVARHRDPDRYGRLYRMLLRLQDEPSLLEIASDEDVIRARAMQKAVRRDTHKMTAFLRFRAVGDESGEAFLAWFEPEHFIEEHVAPFFVDRFASQRFAIVTPRATIAWDGSRLEIRYGRFQRFVLSDDLSEAWNVYFRSTFNPARVKTDAMRAEMPKKYWRNLPETAAIADLVRGAGDRTRSFVEAGPTSPPLRHLVAEGRRMTQVDPEEPAGEVPIASLDQTRLTSAGCRRCPLWEPATQTVFGEGPDDAPLMFVGEQPGDREDLVGRPFVGPAGQVFDLALAEAGIDRRRIYVTNAVKHFKFEPRGKRRIHAKPSTAEIDACRFWLDHERRLVSPALVVALGATALRGLTGRTTAVQKVRGTLQRLPDGTPLIATVHPSYLLRLPDAATQAVERQAFVDDLILIRQTLGEIGVPAATQT